LADKGLKGNVVGLFGGTMIGISSIAPAYALTATLGILAASVGAKTPVVIIAGFLPMFFAAYTYREFNRIMPDAGTSFPWSSKGFGPYIGWLGAWAAVLATIIVLSNLAGVAVQFLYQIIGSAVNSEMIIGLWQNKLINVATCLVFLAIATYVAYWGIDTTADSAFNSVFKFLFPLLGGLGLFLVLIITLRDSADPSYGSGASIGGIGLVLILGLGLILVGLVFMAIPRVRQPPFLRGETLIHESVHAMRPHEHRVS
jgi:amino acid transporter